MTELLLIYVHQQLKGHSKTITLIIAKLTNVVETPAWGFNSLTFYCYTNMT